MRSKLQYIYSISVFVGVLVTSYMMMSKDDSARLPQTVQTPGARFDASVADPAVQSLIDIEKALRGLKKEKPVSQKRSPSFNRPAE